MLSIHGGIIIALNRMDRILEVDLENERAVIEPGVVNLLLTQAVANKGYHYAPDPSSQKACTIGGNIAENSGGPHTLKYGVTSDHVLGLEVVLPDGEIVELGGAVEETLGYDLRGVMIGSEGTFGIVTKANRPDLPGIRRPTKPRSPSLRRWTMPLTPSQRLSGKALFPLHLR